MTEAVLEINVTAFKAKCLELFKQLEARRYDKVVVTRRGKPIAELRPADLTLPDLYGALKGYTYLGASTSRIRFWRTFPRRSRARGPSSEKPALVLLDTCASIWLFEQQPMSDASLDAIRLAAGMARVLISPVSAWEVGLLARRARARLSFQPSPHDWFTDLLALAGMRLTPLSPRAAIAASYLPGTLHSDPADRLLIATARDLGVPLVTRDRRILDYAAQGHVEAIAC